MSAAYSSFSDKPLYLLNITTDRENSVEKIVNCFSEKIEHFNQINTVDQLSNIDQPFNLILIAHGGIDRNLYATFNAVDPVCSRDELVLRIEEKCKKSENSVGIFACVCSGSMFEQSTTTDYVQWNAYSFNDINAETFIKRVKAIAGIYD